MIRRADASYSWSVCVTVHPHNSITFPWHIRVKTTYFFLNVTLTIRSLSNEKSWTHFGIWCAFIRLNRCLFVATGACIHNKGCWTFVAVPYPQFSFTWVRLKLDPFLYLIWFYFSSIFGPYVLFSTKLKQNCSVFEVVHLKQCAFAEKIQLKQNVTAHILATCHTPTVYEYTHAHS